MHCYCSIISHRSIMLVVLLSFGAFASLAGIDATIFPSGWSFPLDPLQPARPCVRREYHDGIGGGYVCVCNATYCDDVAGVGELNENDVVVYYTSASGRRLERVTTTWKKMLNSKWSKAERDKGKSGNTDKAEGVVVRINATQRFQSIIGFGGAFTDSAGINFNSLSDGARQNLLNSYFSTNGLEYSLGRVPMASCDFSTREYSYDDVDGDFGLANFNLTDEDRQMKIPYILQALALTNGDMKLFASPWSAPAWMKSNEHMRGGGTLKGLPGGPYYTTWANYFVKFLEAYQAYNITFWGMTAQNEPTTGSDANYGWQTMYFNASMQRDFIANTLGPTLRRSIYGQRIALMTMDDQRFNLPMWADTVFADTQASFYTAGVALHWYEDIDTIFPPTLLSRTHDRHPDKFILATEACTGYWPWELKPILGDWLRGDSYAHDIITDLNHYVAGWTDWNLALNLEGGPNWVNNTVDSPIIVNATADEFYKQPMFYVLGHFSKFIRPNSTRIGLTIEHSVENLEGTAFSTPTNQRVLVISNRMTEKTFRLSIQDAAMPGKVLNINLEPQTIATVIWNKE